MSPKTFRSELLKRLPHDRVEILLQLASPLPADLAKNARSVWERQDMVRDFLTNAKQPLVEALSQHDDLDLVDKMPGTRDVFVVGEAGALAAALASLESEVPQDFEVFENLPVYLTAR